MKIDFNPIEETVIPAFRGGEKETAVMYFIAGLLMCCTIISIPLGVQRFKIVGYSLMPFGKDNQLRMELLRKYLILLARLQMK